ncbi:MAG: ATP-binding protein [Anaerolineae bacterium]|nr:ATP-binding protein [Anaerolineae bacterium]
MAQPFETSLEHLHAELARLDLLLQREIWRWRQSAAHGSPDDQEFRGIYVADAEIDAILSGIYPGSDQVARQAAGQPVETAFDQALERAAAEIAERKAASLQQGIPLRLVQLQRLFGLDDFDVDVLLIALLPEIDLRYERIYAYLQDDMTRKCPAVSLTLNLLCATPGDRLAARAHFWLNAPLLRHHLITLLGNPARPYPPLLAQDIKPDARIVELLLAESIMGRGEASPERTCLSSIAPLSRPSGQLATSKGCLALTDARLRNFCDLTHVSVTPVLFLPPDVRDQLEQLAASPDTGQAAALILLQGDPGTGRHTAAQSLCTAWRRPLLTVHLRRLVDQGEQFETLARLAAREACLSDAVLYWQDYDAVNMNAEYSMICDALHSILLEYPITNMLPIREAGQEPAAALLSVSRLVRVILPCPSYSLRCMLWKHFLQMAASLSAADLSPILDAVVPALAQRFRLTGGQIRDAVLDARHRAEQRPAERRALTADDLFAAARARTSGQLNGLANKIELRHAWADLVLPDDQLAQLRELCDQMNYRARVLGEWGFERKLSLGKGLNVLFAGPSGTGKTMAAEVIAGELSLDLFKIDLSTVVSKYVGETEKNLDRIFRAAHNSNAILFFDEADALFGKRSEVRDAHDRYANVEISYLLQKMEEYDGLVILTSNLNKNMDEAFVRRMHFTVEFPYPEEEARQRVWQIAFPAEAPLAPNVDFGLLADRYRLTGGNIRNVALTAAFLAARDGGIINMEHLLWATRREFQKLGRLADEYEFGTE